ncbi:MAG: type II 3-dehydroquinate dehydratase [Pseudotabrizicola sp.]|uniref:type II 3-dehydroquinate dehydratase n=1 Tax=Pseudotabrizicola sp. TaxID=2939647 RepID=UPI002731278E|nr:type II 3-dehydroquinate dehydratase [Pseudotabrizicola sp.]MDP2081189.1 type II 3-dehydroquinate dehydratase [Pseudotabrizicola sp.]MDZ7575587.1 type II 3-dehydroquinate dehydratase [Pseudotabrizicola sp.]
MPAAIHVLNGPNLNRLGSREPEIYGHTTLAEVKAICEDAAGAHPMVFLQSNAEHQIIDWIHEAIDAGAGAIVINPAGLTFTSVPIMDALKMFPGVVIELHISNIHRREAVYHQSLVSKVATAVIAGLGPDGYRSAVDGARRILGAIKS